MPDDFDFNRIFPEGVWRHTAKRSGGGCEPDIECCLEVVELAWVSDRLKRDLRAICEGIREMTAPWTAERRRKTLHYLTVFLLEVTDGPRCPAEELTADELLAVLKVRVPIDPAVEDEIREKTGDL
jgi:hypothetical protein